MRRSEKEEAGATAGILAGARRRRAARVSSPLRGLAEIVDLKFFCGFSFAEIAAMRGVSERTIQRNWEKGRLYLHHAIGSGSPAPVSANAAHQP